MECIWKLAGRWNYLQVLMLDAVMLHLMANIFVLGRTPEVTTARHRPLRLRRENGPGSLSIRKYIYYKLWRNNFSCQFSTDKTKIIFKLFIFQLPSQDQDQILCLEKDLAETLLQQQLQKMIHLLLCWIKSSTLRRRVIRNWKTISRFQISPFNSTRKHKEKFKTIFTTIFASS